MVVVFDRERVFQPTGPYESSVVVINNRFSIIIFLIGKIFRDKPISQEDYNRQYGSLVDTLADDMLVHALYNGSY